MFALLCLASLTTAAGAAQSVPDLGTLTFPTSTKSAEAQTDFVRGMLLLHLFEYDRAKNAFEDAEKIDPGFAMAYWGEAMTATHPVWNQQDMDAGRAALAKLGPTPQARAAKAGSAREKGFLAAVEKLYGEGTKLQRDRYFLAAMAGLAKKYPRDDEVQLFYSLALLGVSQGERNVPNYLRAAAIAKRVYAHNPDHPGAAHYWIHGMDDPAHAAGALVAANALSKIAPGAGHGQHMTAHIFIALGMWDEVLAANVNALTVVANDRRAKNQPVVACGHYAEWLQYAYYQLGRHREAQRVLTDCQRDRDAAIAWYQAHPDQSPVGFKTLAAMKSRLDSSLIDMRAVAIVESPQNRAASAALTLETADAGDEAGWDSFARGLNAAWTGDIAAANADLAALNVARQKNSGKPEDQSTFAYLGILAQVLTGVIAERGGHADAALAQVTAAARSYDALPFDYGPPVPVKPPHELAGEMLLAMHRPKEALAEFDLSLRSAPRRALSLLGRARALAALDDSAGATAVYRELLGIWKQADDDVPGLAEAKAALEPTTAAASTP